MGLFSWHHFLVCFPFRRDLLSFFFPGTKYLLRNLCTSPLLDRAGLQSGHKCFKINAALAAGSWVEDVCRGSLTPLFAGFYP
jgi:hypothetical protein